MFDAHIIRDLPDEPGGNVQHIAQHGFASEEIESVLFGDGMTIPSQNSEAMVTFGYTDSGEYIAVVWEHVDDDPMTIRPITAYKTPEPGPRRRRK